MRALMVGRFQPFHNGHLAVIRELAERFDAIIIGIGSADQSHSKDNPFTAGERHLMISCSLEEEGILDYYLVPIVDLNRYALWVAHVESLVPPFDRVFSNNPLTRRLFEESGYEVEKPFLYDRHMYSGQLIRKLIVEDGNWQKLVPAGVARMMEEIEGAVRLRALAKGDVPGSLNDRAGP